MKTNILKISILPLVVVVALSLADFQQGKENKGNGNKSEEKGNQSNGGQVNKGNNNPDNSGQGNKNRGQADNGKGTPQGNKSNGQDKRDDDNQGNRGDKGGKGNSKNDDSRGKSDNDKGMSENDKGKGNKDKNVSEGNDKNGKGNGKSRKENIQWDRDENVNWGFENYSKRKRPGDFKKVTVCHKTGDGDYPVMINVSENALKAHLNHGDQVGNCTGNYSSRWPADILRTRENVYNNYQNTWETMSYSEALVRFAADKLLGIKSSLQTQRSTLTADQIQRREAAIMDLQNNVNSLENQLAVSRQRTSGLNININL
ncbi:hypothetical protein [Daejeonella sp.]|uniref:hypothetical protein n=1 Tax=Daejeonella sp. TaxID=2805397 RepID=UPI0030BBCED4